MREIVFICGLVVVVAVALMALAISGQRAYGALAPVSARCEARGGSLVHNFEGNWVCVARMT